MQKSRNPRPPQPQLVFGDGPYLGSYAWRIDHSGITALGDSKAECITNWHKAYQSEYFSDQ